MDSTTTAGLAAAFGTGVAAPPAGGGIGGPAGFSVVATDVSVFGLLSTPLTSAESHGHETTLTLMPWDTYEITESHDDSDQLSLQNRTKLVH